MALAPDGGDAVDVHLGVALWPYDLLLRFGYELPEHEYRWEGQWFDDRFEVAALDLRASAAKLLLSLSRMAQAGRTLASLGGTVAEMRRVAEAAPMEVDLVVSYLGRITNGV